MNIHILDVPFVPATGPLLSRLGLSPESDEAGDFLALLGCLAPLARPKAALMTARVEKSASPGRVSIGGIEFNSALLADNLAGEPVAWPYLATCGGEMHAFTTALPDPFERYWAEEIMRESLDAAVAALERHLCDSVFSGKTASMSPGSLADWPIEQQRPLFRLLADAAGRCGVTLTDSLLMIPSKSVSGVYFHNEHGFVNCRFCPRPDCPNRRAEYDSDYSR